MRSEKRQGVALFSKVLRAGPSESETIVCAGAATDFIKQYE
jgi:hypothetical protein